MIPPPRLNSSSITLQAENCPSNGRPCQVPVSWTDGVSITPESIEKIIRMALLSGWNPDGRGSWHELPAIFVDELDTKMNIVRKVLEN
jgi:hypothetical protein